MRAQWVSRNLRANLDVRLLPQGIQPVAQGAVSGTSLQLGAHLAPDVFEVRRPTLDVSDELHDRAQDESNEEAVGGADTLLDILTGAEISASDKNKLVQKVLRQLIESYGDGRFRVSGAVYEGSVLVLPERSRAWPVAAIEEITLDSLAPVTAAAAALEILLIGCGPRLARVPADLRQALRDAGVVVEPMDTGAACRTYNVLVTEDRPVAAALIAVD